jgi:hypothetical protein
VNPRLRSRVWEVFGAIAQLVERFVRNEEVGSSTLLRSTFIPAKPFGEYVEGLTHYGDESYADEFAVRPQDFENPTPGVEIRLNPLLLQRL